MDFLIRLLIATAAGGAIGLEREINNKSAGLRTNTLVSIGAALYLLIAMEILEGTTSGDPSRVVGQIVTGIGFLGAGVILHRGPNVQGLTTAATIWCSAALGCLAALGLYWQLAVATILVILVNAAFKVTDTLFSNHHNRQERDRLKEEESQTSLFSPHDRNIERDKITDQNKCKDQGDCNESLQ